MSPSQSPTLLSLSAFARIVARSSPGSTRGMPGKAKKETGVRLIDNQVGPAVSRPVMPMPAPGVLYWRLIQIRTEVIASAAADTAPRNLAGETDDKVARRLVVAEHEHIAVCAAAYVEFRRADIVERR